MKLQKSLISVLFVVLVGLLACQRDDRRLSEAEVLIQQGLEHRAAKKTVDAAECFSQALIVINQCDAEKPKVQKLKAQAEDNLGAMYWKHGLADEALQLHLDAVALLRKLFEPKLLMTALRNCGRVLASQQRIGEAQAYYDEAWQIADGLKDKTFCNELLMETSHDLYLESGDFAKAIENASQALKAGADPGFCNLVIGLSQYYLDENAQALVALQEAAKSEKPSVRMSAYQALYLIYQEEGNYNHALQCHELYNENMMEADRIFRSEQMERIKADYDLQMQKYNLQAEQKIKNLKLYILIGLLLAALIVTLLLLRQKSLKEKLKAEESKNHLEQALKKNKVYLTALALSEQITASSLDFNLKEEDWNDFVNLINMIYDGFTSKLLEKYPTLTPSDLQICCLTKQGFSNQVLAIIMNMQAASYARRKSRIKQEKMNGLNDGRSFEEIINEI